jgi:prepilin-type N-terminal cleavage/methylation domain-containing protein
MQRQRGFTLVEIVIAVFILLLLLTLAVPSLNGVLADKRLHRSLDRFNELVRQAHERSLAEHRAYLIVWNDVQISLQPAAFLKTEPHEPIDTMPITRQEKWQLELPAALSKKVPAEWIFWESGVCEPARIRFASDDGSWTTEYSPLSGLAEIIAYAPRK